MRALDDAIEARVHEPEVEQPRRLALPYLEHLEQGGDVGLLEVVARPFDLVAEPQLAPGDARRPVQVLHPVLPLEHHADAVEAVGELGRHHRKLEPAALLEVGELGDLGAVEPHLPAEPGGPQGGRLPVVLDQPEIVVARLDAEGCQRIEILLDHVFGSKRSVVADRRSP